MSKLTGAAQALKGPTRGHQVIVGRFTMNNTSAPTKIVPGVGWSVARTGVGVYLITLDRAYKKVLHAGAGIVGATGNNKRAVATALTDGTVRLGATVQLEMQNTATAADQTSLDCTFIIHAAQEK